MPDWRDISVWRRLVEAPELVAAAEAVDSREASAIARLRRRWDADLVAAALELAEARRKAAGKFSRARELWCDVAGVEQASDERVAAWKAGRVRGVLATGDAVLDVCCGIGGDSMALAGGGFRVTAVDVDERRAWMASVNAGCAAQVREAESLELEGVVLHADPARRDERSGGRSWSLEDHRPGRDWLERALRVTRGAAIKFSPGVDRREFAAGAIEWEFIQHRAALVQAVAWSGVLAGRPGQTRATVLTDGTESTLVGSPDDARADRLEAGGSLVDGCFVSEPCAALERAMLLSEAGGGRAKEIVRGAGLVVSDAPLAAPWFESFAYVDECAPRADAVAERLVRHGLEARSVRVRGRAVEADAFTKALGARPSGNAVVFAFRRAERATAVIARITPGG